jgi:hypothetical protein
MIGSPELLPSCTSYPRRKCPDITSLKAYPRAGSFHALYISVNRLIFVVLSYRS